MSATVAPLPKENITILSTSDTEKKTPPTSAAVKDIYLAAFLLALGYKIEYARSASYQSEFWFENVPSSVILAYYNDTFVKELTSKKLFDAFQNARRVSRQVRLIPAGASDKVEEGHEDLDE